MRIVACLDPRGGQGRDVLDAAEAAGMELAGVLLPAGALVEDPPYTVLGRVDGWPDFADGSTSFVLAIGDASERIAMGRKMRDHGVEVLGVVHPAAVVSKRAALGTGVVILAGTVIAPDAHIGDYVVLNANCAIDHDCVLGEGAQLGPGVTLAGRVQIDQLAFVGVGATILPAVHIGARAVVGGGAVVIRDVTPGTTVAGNPAKPLPRKP